MESGLEKCPDLGVDKWRWVPADVWFKAYHNVQVTAIENDMDWVTNRTWPLPQKGKGPRFVVIHYQEEYVGDGIPGWVPVLMTVHEGGIDSPLGEKTKILHYVRAGD